MNFSSTRYPQVRTVRQESAMTEEDREEFLSYFALEEGAVLGFCVLGGVFSEGIDLKGDRLIGVAVVSVGLPQLGLRTKPDSGLYTGTQRAGLSVCLYVSGNQQNFSGGRSSDTDKEESGGDFAHGSALWTKPVSRFISKGLVSVLSGHTAVHRTDSKRILEGAGVLAYAILFGRKWQQRKLSLHREWGISNPGGSRA